MVELYGSRAERGKTLRKRIIENARDQLAAGSERLVPEGAEEFVRKVREGIEVGIGQMTADEQLTPHPSRSG